MAMVHRHVEGWPAFGWPKHRSFELEWLGMEEFHHGDTLVVRAELPDVDPDKDVEDHLRASSASTLIVSERLSRRTREVTVPSFATVTPNARLPCPKVRRP